MTHLNEFVRRASCSALAIFATWMVIFGLTVIMARTWASWTPMVTRVEVHSESLIPGYDLVILVVAAGVVIAARRMRSGIRQVGPELIGCVVAVALAVGMEYYAAGTFDSALPRPFSAEEWFLKGSVAYGAIVLLLLGISAILATASAKRRNQEADRLARPLSGAKHGGED